MSLHMQKSLVLLELLFKLKPSVRRVILGNARADFVYALCEIAFNVVHGNIPLFLCSLIATEVQIMSKFWCNLK